jgi:UDP-N-acetylmuramoyl-L-alanyl-D-glutamate--2,6-diaminopimelate ligase
VKLPVIYPVSCHTDHIGPKSTFVAIQGMNSNGASYILSALQKGADTIVVDQLLSVEQQQLIQKHGARVVEVPNARAALASLSATATHDAHKKLKIIGITGTKGKTTTALLLFHLMNAVGKKVGLISTVFNAINEKRFSSSLTTPQPDYLHQFFKTAVDEGVEWVVMEVAAQAITLHRIDGIQFDAIALLNIGREHLEFYKDMDAYSAAKLRLLSYRKPEAPAWINQDDPYLHSISAEHVHWFGAYGALSAYMKEADDFCVHCICTYYGTPYEMRVSHLAGRYNMYNLMAASALALHTGITWEQMQRAVTSFPGIAGRLERYSLPNGATALIDYAHNPLSYRALFQAVRPLTNHLIILFGAGGERDGGRRPEMGAIAAEYGDVIVLTSDNPRSEDPQKIVTDIMKGILPADHSKVLIELDRKKAIQSCYARSKKGSLMLLLGKGPDEYQLVNGVKIPFSEKQIIQSL